MAAQADPFGINAAQRYQLGAQTGDPKKIGDRGFFSYLVPFLQGATSTDRGMLWAGLGAVQRQKRLDQYAAFVAQQEADAKNKLKDQEYVRGQIAQLINPDLYQVMQQGNEGRAITGLSPDIVSDGLIQQGGNRYGNEAASNVYNEALRNPQQMPYLDPYMNPEQKRAMFEMMQKNQQGYITQQALQEQYPGYMNQGAGVAGGIYGQPQQAPVPQQGQAPQQPMTENGLMYGQIQQADQPLQGGVRQQALPGYVQDAATMNPMFLPQVSEGSITGGINQGADIYGKGKAYNLDVRQQNETERQNKAAENIAWYNAKSQRISATKPSGGGSGNPYTIPNAQQNYLQGQIKSIDDQLALLGAVEAKGDNKGALRFDVIANNPQAAALFAQRQQLTKMVVPGYSYDTRSPGQGQGESIGRGLQGAPAPRRIPSFKEVMGR